MPNDSATFLTPVVGIWLYGVPSMSSQFVWSMCSRLVLCRNFQERNKIPIRNNPDTLIVMNLKPGSHPEFYQMRVIGE